MPVNEAQFNQQAYEQHSARVRSSSDSPEGGDVAIHNNATVYLTAQHPNSGANDNPNGLRYATASDVRYENYEYQHSQHHQAVHHNAHGNGNGDDNIKIELIRNQHALHGKVCWHNVLKSFSKFLSICVKKIRFISKTYISNRHHKPNQKFSTQI